MEAICSSETSILTRATRRHIKDDGILHSHRRENLKSYIEIKIISGSRARSVREACKFTAICEPIV
jgi:hypothetical protein